MTTAEEAALDRLDEALRQYERDYRRYFAGDLPLPPESQEERIRARLRALRGQQLKRAADSFRLSGLEARFASYVELFGRRLREREEGRAVGRPAAVVVERPTYQRDAGVVVDHRADREIVAELWNDLSRVGGAGNLDVDGLATYLERQAEAIRAKTGRSKVQFRIVEEDGRVKLKARPLA